jgi:hypothetical protein
MFPSWISEDLPGGYHLTVHPDLNITRFKNENLEIILLGYILDPYSPMFNDLEILNKRITGVFSITDLIHSFFDLAGRYVCIAFIGNQYYLFSDTLGFRTVYFRIHDHQIWCASQPSLLAEYFGLTSDRNIEADLFQTKMFRKKDEHWYPGTATMFSSVFHLLPNHYLDFKESHQHRYWPSSPIEQLTLTESAQKCAKILEKIMESAAARFNLSIAVTSGLDSRMVLAGCRSIKNNLCFFTHTHPGINHSSADIRIPLEMSHHFGLTHIIMSHADEIDNDFSRIINRNVINARRGKTANAFTVYNHFLREKNEKVVVHGVPGEITRHFYFQPPGIHPDASLLLYLSGLTKSNIARTEFELWLKDVNAIPGYYSVRILDLFYWEQRIGNWASLSYNEYDIAFESLTPFSCRTFLTTMLGVKSRQRIAPGFELQRRIIGNLWPELLDYDINPAETFTESLKKLLANSGIHKAYKYFSYARHAAK